MKQVIVHCSRTGIRVSGANDVGSTSDTVVSSRSGFMRVAEHWWNSYCGGRHCAGPDKKCGDCKKWARTEDEPILGSCPHQEGLSAEWSEHCPHWKGSRRKVRRNRRTKGARKAVAKVATKEK